MLKGPRSWLAPLATRWRLGLAVSGFALLVWGWSKLLRSPYRPKGLPTLLGTLMGVASVFWLLFTLRWTWSSMPVSLSVWWRSRLVRAYSALATTWNWFCRTRIIRILNHPIGTPRDAIRGRAVQAASYFKGYWSHPVLSDNIVYQDAEQWIREYMPCGGTEGSYASALKFSKDQYDQSLKLTESLDKKSDDIIRTAGVIAGVVATVAKLSISGNAPGGLTAVNLAEASGSGSTGIAVSVGCLVFSVMIAVRARAPAELSTPMDGRTALAVVEFRRIDPGGGPVGMTPIHVVEATTAATYHYATIGMNVINSWKARQLDRASNAFILGIVILLGQVISPMLKWW